MRIIPAVTVFLLLLAVSMLLIRFASPEAVQTEAVEKAVKPNLTGVKSGEIAGYLRKVVGFGSRFLGHRGCEEAALYIASLFKERGLEVYLDNFSLGRFKGVNVVGVKRGEGLEDMWVIVCAHYDTSPGTRGADDNGTGVSVLLWLSGKLENNTLNKTIVLIAFSGEEVGLAGSEHYVEQYFEELTAHRAVVINIDAVGYGEHLWITAGPPPITQESARLMKLMLKKAEEMNITIKKANYVLASDHLPFKRHGIPSVAVTESLLNPYLHSVEDSLDKVNMETVCKAAKLVWETLKELCKTGERVPKGLSTQ